MKYYITPLNIISVILLIISIYAMIKPGTWGFGFLLGIYILPIILLTLGFDFLLQNILKKRLNLFLLEFLLLGILYFFHLYSERTKTYIVPNNFEDKYIITIYDFPNAEKLPDGWNYQVKIPDNGVFYTSSSKEKDLKKTKFFTKSGLDLNNQKNELGFGEILEDSINCKGKIYNFKIWKIQKNCCFYSSNETNKLKLNLKQKLCK